ncbi:hypothetical protein M758_7G068900 [Ceratodon purpureus]|uniref:Uncharacterized protein n=1 Tax=Ceratodon purpureus TaxID=3225 RepID=A0A8T0HBW0_CERPU|nr:hypothetical protein KC19_7G075500 [Ceratodon purpureus]KAG0610476.1 hypothetical protein M758_7G068900 [Ceratodon purpureus]
MPGVEDRLYLTYFAADIPEKLPQHVASNNQCNPRLGQEPAGICFHEAAKRQRGVDKEPEEVEEAVPDKKDKSTESPSVDSYQFKGKKKSGDGPETQDHYALLGLSHLRFLATEDQIRKSYRDAALKHHPDKQASLLLLEDTEEKKEAKKEEIDRHFKSIQLAYEVLIDPVKRRAYDSIDEFDDEIPSDCAPGDFFKVFGPVFARNGRWSTVQPVPSLGENETDIATVDEFYDFWWTFKSWREFPHADDFDLEQAESREHKRWMERQNAKLREKAKKEENARIRLMTENAYKKDPRIARRKEEEKAEKLRKKQAKSQARRDKEEEAARAVEEERLRKEEEDKRAAEEASAQKKQKEKEKKLLRKEKARLRAVAAGVVAQKDSGISDDDIENFCTTLEIAFLRGLCEKLEGIVEVDEQTEYLKKVISGAETIVSSDSAAASTPSRVNSSASLNTDFTPTKTEVEKQADNKKGTAEKGKKSTTPVVEKKERPWTKQEVDLLRKAVAKYPKGTSQRWEVVSNYIGTNRTVEEILKGVKTVLLQKPDSSKAFDSFLQKRKPGAEINSPLSTREDGEETASPKAAGNGTVGGSKQTRAGAESVNAKKVENGTVEESQSNGAAANGAVEAEGWSEAQEVALVKAIKAFPKDTANRWERIASAVPGKSKAQCFKKFAELRENFRSTKKAE